MKKIVSWISALALLTVAMAFPASAAEVEVTDDESLKSAVEAAAPGDTIVLAPGTYETELEINKQLHLKGEKGAKLFGIVLRPESDGTVIEGFDFYGASNKISADVSLGSVYLYGTADDSVDNITIKNNNFKVEETRILEGQWAPEVTANDTIAIITTYVNDLVVDGNIITDYATTAYHNPFDSSNITYQNNEVTGSKSGIAFLATDGVTVKNNRFENANGVRIDPDWSGTGLCTNVTISENKFISPNESSDYGVYDVRTQTSSGTAGYDGDLSVDGNYWGGREPALTGGNITYQYYYTDEAMTEKAWTAEATKTATTETFAQVMAEASEGDLIILGAGEYTDSLKVTKGVTIQAEDGATVDYMEIQADNVTIDGVTFDGVDNPANDVAPTSIYIRGGKKNIAVTNCTFALHKDVTEAKAKGIVTESSGMTGLTVSGNSFDDTYETAVYLNPYAIDVVLENNQVDTLYGFRAIGVENVTITGNTFTGTRGIEVRKGWSGNACSDFTVEGNVFDGSLDVLFPNVSTEGNPFGDEILDVSKNYWKNGEAPTTLQIPETTAEYVTYDSYYKNIDEATGDPIDLVTLPGEEDVVDGEVVFEQNGTKVDVYLEGRFDGQPALISNFVAAEFTIAMTGDLAAATIEPGDGLVVVPQGDGYYLFHKQEDGADLSGDSIKLGTITLGGFGTGTIGVDGTGKMQRRIADSVVYSGEVTGKTTDLNLAQETVKLTIHVAFNNNITAGNTAAYNDFTVTVKDAQGNAQVYKLGSGTEENVNYVDNYTAESAKIEVDVTKGYRYSIEAQGAGYRTYRTSVLADGDKTVNLWNNVKDAEAEVTTGVNATKNFLAGDIVMDNVINLYDLSAVVSYFGQGDINTSEASQYARYDLNRDGKIDSKDVAMVLVSWEE